MSDINGKTGNTGMVAHAVKQDRRGFLKLAGASIIGGGPAVAAASGAAAADSEAPAPGGDYRLTESVKRCYDLAREF